MPRSSISCLAFFFCCGKQIACLGGIAGRLVAPVLEELTKFVLLCWLNAFYAYDYRWALEGKVWGRRCTYCHAVLFCCHRLNIVCWWIRFQHLQQRLQVFESNWQFFGGFGTPIVILTWFFPPFIGAGVLTALFPLWIIIATVNM